MLLVESCARSRSVCSRSPPLCSALARAQQAPEIPDDFFDELEYRHIGPLGNRVILGESASPETRTSITSARLRRGVFKSTDGGVVWTPVFDGQPVSSIGSLALAPSDPNVLWAGTGRDLYPRKHLARERDLSLHGPRRELGAPGTSTRRDASDGCESIPRTRIGCSPARLGHTYGPQPERGVYRTQDGGETWEQVLFVDENTGCADLVMDPNNPRILFAGMWEIHVNTWGRQSGGPGSSLWMSRDGGDTWESLQGSGLPDKPWGKIGLDISAANSDRVFALIETSSNADFAPSDPFPGRVVALG